MKILSILFLILIVGCKPAGDTAPSNDTKKKVSRKKRTNPRDQIENIETSVESTIEETVDNTTSTGEDVVNVIVTTPEEDIVDEVTENVNDTVNESVSEVATDTANNIENTTNQNSNSSTKETTDEVAETVEETVDDTVNDVVETVEETVNEGTETVEETTEEVAETTEETVNEGIETAEETIEEVAETTEKTIDFQYNLLAGSCSDSYGDVGLNQDFGPCSDMTNYDFQGQDLTQNEWWGSIFHGSSLIDSTFDLYDLTYQEVDFNLDTRFPESYSNPFSSISQYNIDAMTYIRKRRAEITKEISKLQKQNKNWKKALQKNPDNENLIRKYKENVDQIADLNNEIKNLNSQQNRHEDFYSKYRNLASDYEDLYGTD